MRILVKNLCVVFQTRLYQLQSLYQTCGMGVAALPTTQLHSQSIAVTEGSSGQGLGPSSAMLFCAFTFLGALIKGLGWGSASDSSSKLPYVDGEWSGGRKGTFKFLSCSLTQYPVCLHYCLSSPHLPRPGFCITAAASVSA